MEKAAACSVCGERSHVSRQCSELYVPPPEGLPNPDGGGKRAGNPEPEEDSLGLCLSFRRTHSNLAEYPTHRVM